MKIEVLKTHELSQTTWDELTREFNLVFRQNKTSSRFIKYYSDTILGYSYHAVAYNEKGRIVGYNSIIPMKYSSTDNNILIGLSGGSFVVEESRKDIFIFYDLMNSLWKTLSKDKIVATLGIANENSYRYAIEFLGSTPIMDLRYYALPFRLSALINRKYFKLFDVFSISLYWILLYLNYFVALAFNFRERKSIFEVIPDESFMNLRFPADVYKKITGKGETAYYRIVDEKGIRTAYLMDFRENGKRTLSSMCMAVKKILLNEKPDMVLFVGTLKLRQFLLTIIPSRFEPQKLPLTFNLTSNEFQMYLEAMRKKENWNFSLMNFDAR